MAYDHHHDGQERTGLEVAIARHADGVVKRLEVESRYTSGLLTPRSLADNFADLNSVLARHLGLEKSQRRFIGVLRERCTPRLSVRALYYLDITDDDEFDINVARLVSQLRQAPEIRRTDD
jgi:hypothetical protein